MNVSFDPKTPWVYYMGFQMRKISPIGPHRKGQNQYSNPSLNLKAHVPSSTTIMWTVKRIQVTYLRKNEDTTDDHAETPGVQWLIWPLKEKK